MNIMEGSTGHAYRASGVGDVDVAVLVVPPKTPKINARKILRSPRSHRPFGSRNGRQEIRKVKTSCPRTGLAPPRPTALQRTTSILKRPAYAWTSRRNATAQPLPRPSCANRIHCTICSSACEQEIAAGNSIGICIHPLCSGRFYCANHAIRVLARATMDAYGEADGSCDGMAINPNLPDRRNAPRPFWREVKIAPHPMAQIRLRRTRRTTDRAANCRYHRSAAARAGSPQVRRWPPRSSSTSMRRGARPCPAPHRRRSGLHHGAGRLRCAR